ncbi:aminoglycoside phosphotransferase family protein [Pseudonocardia nigra]|uniref:aminoglycoside phosphotransferase family protein n=1 Tax=Pseudonocardia nigra TaxID=1921578 RepID=UPI001C5E4D62|nr:aminoglycoside phosphotransferase family protein [Pseudonocardia nigra]
MDRFPLPVALADAVAQEDSPERTDWLARLPELVRALAVRWSLTVGPPYQPGGVASWVAPARDASGRDVVLKVGWSHFESAHEADGLAAWDGRGAVRLHDVHVDGPTTALLLERCVPGTTLRAALPEPEQDEVVAALLRKLWHEPGAGHPFRPLASMCDAWADAFDEDYAGRPGDLDPGIARAAMDLFRGLPRDAGPHLLLVTDLHADNVLAARREPWLLIDPKPYVGDPTYDVLQHLLNCRDRLVADPRGSVRRMAALADVDAERAERWLFARAVQQSLDPPWRWLRPVARALAP